MTKLCHTMIVCATAAMLLTATLSGAVMAQTRADLPAWPADIAFAPGDIRVPNEADASLQRAAKLLADNPSLRLFVIGHSDDRGSAEAKASISLRRAAAVARSLAQIGIDPARLVVRGVGASAPKALNRTEQGRAENRRVEIVPFSTAPVVADKAQPQPAAAPAEPAPAVAPSAKKDERPDEATSVSRAEIEKIVREYIIAHPEVLQEAMAELEKRQNAAELEKQITGVRQNKEVLFNSAHQVTLGNPKGDVTMVEFFDYNCGYCKKALGDMLTLLKDDPNLKVVLKEYPVLGPGSLEAAQVAVAVRMQDKTGKKYLDFHQRLLGGHGAADKARALAAAKDAGFDMARLEKDMGSDEVRETLKENMKVADAIGLNGTPSYVIGSDVVIGAQGYDVLKEKVDAARK